MIAPGEAPRIVNVRQDPRDRVPDSPELDAPLPAYGTISRCIAVGSLRVVLTGLDDRFAALVDEGYRGFVAPVSDGDASATRLDVVRSPEPRWLYLPRAEGRSEEARVGARSTASRLELWSYFFAAWLDREGRSGRLLLCDVSDLDAGQAVENTLRFLVSIMALAHGAFLLHAAGVVRGGRAWAFFGPSGAGKSTTASHAPDDALLLGDDLLLVEEREGTWHACGVPFRGTFARGDNHATSAPLAAALRLFQAETNRLEQAPRSIQVAELLGEVPFLLDDKEVRERAAGLVERFARAVPVKRLYLCRDGSYWALLE